MDLGVNMWNYFFQNETKHKKQFVFFNILFILCDSVSVFIPILLGYLVDRGLQNQDFHFLILFGIAILVFILLKTLGAVYCVIKEDKITLEIEKKKKVNLFAKVEQFDRFFFNQNSVGELMTLINSDIGNLTRWLRYNIKTIAFLVLSFIVAFVYYFLVSWQMTLILLCFIIISSFISYQWMKKNKKYYEKIRSKNAFYHHRLQDYIDGIQTLRSLNTMDFEENLIKEQNREIVRLDLSLQKRRIWFHQVMFLASNFLTILFLFGASYFF